MTAVSLTARLLLLCCAGLPAFGAPRESALDRQWKGIEHPASALSSRSLFDFALDAVALEQHPERIEEAFAVAARMQDRSPASPTYGNFKWYWGDAGPDDLNAVEFCMQKAALIRILYNARLTPAARDQLAGLMRYSVEGLHRHTVKPRYTNIFLMKSWNLVAIGECTGQPALAKEGYEALNAWWDWTLKNGIGEYLSPTYYGIDLDSLGLLARHSTNESARATAASGVRLLWTDIAANWFAPGERLGGSHSRDYDYLTGHGVLDRYLRAAGWLTSANPESPDVFVRLGAWAPPAGLREWSAAALPRTVCRRWGDRATQTAVHYVGRHFSMGSAGEGSGPEDKVLVVNFPGGPRTVVGNFVMDGRGDPYGTNKEITGGGHRKSHHLTPFVTSVQNGPSALMLVADDSSVMRSGKTQRSLSRMGSHFVFPNEARVWFGDEEVKPPAEGRSAPVPAERAVFLRKDDVAIALRFPLALDTRGKAAPLEWVNDGAALGASRITCTHAAAEPQGRGVIALWVCGAEGLDDAAFAKFRRSVQAAIVAAKVQGDLVEVNAEGLRIRADVGKKKRLAAEGGEALKVDGPWQVRLQDGSTLAWDRLPASH